MLEMWEKLKRAIGGRMGERGLYKRLGETYRDGREKIWSKEERIRNRRRE